MPKSIKSDEPLTKKVKTIPFSKTDYLKTKIKIGDKSASVVGYIETVISEESFFKKKDNSKFRIFKFLLNNNDGIRIQCNVYDEHIEKFINQVKLNEKILLENVIVTESKAYSKGNLNYELTLRHYSSISPLGQVDLIKTLKPLIIKFEDIPIKKGLIKIQGYLRNCFVQLNEKINNDFFGVITDGRYKLEVLLNKNENDSISFERGTKLEIIGDLQENGKSYILKVNNVENIKVLTDEKMELENLILGSEIFMIEDANQEKSIDGINKSK